MLLSSGGGECGLMEVCGDLLLSEWWTEVGADGCVNSGRSDAWKPRSGFELGGDGAGRGGEGSGLRDPVGCGVPWLLSYTCLGDSRGRRSPSSPGWLS